MSENMENLYSIMKKHNVQAFSVDSEKCLNQDCGGYVICYIGKEGENYSHIIKECEELFNNKSLEPDDDDFTLFIMRRASNIPNKGVYRLGIDY